MNTAQSTPESVVIDMIAAYKAVDRERIIRLRDFTADSDIFFQSLGLPRSDEQKKKSAKAFETNFRKEIEDSMPDYTEVTFSISSAIYPEPTLAVVAVSGLTKSGDSFSLRIPVLFRNSDWRVILHPDYDKF